MRAFGPLERVGLATALASARGEVKLVEFRAGGQTRDGSRAGETKATGSAWKVDVDEQFYLYSTYIRLRRVTAELGEFGARDARRGRVARDDSKELFVAVPRVNDGAPLGAHPGEDAHTVGELMRADLSASVGVHELV